MERWQLHAGNSTEQVYSSSGLACPLGIFLLTKLAMVILRFGICDAENSMLHVQILTLTICIAY
jgi:hypothetical protein